MTDYQYYKLSPNNKILFSINFFQFLEMIFLLLFLITVAKSSRYHISRSPNYVPFMPIQLPGTDNQVIVDAMVCLSGTDLVITRSLEAFFGIGPGSNLLRRHGSGMVLESNVLFGTDRAMFESACQPDSIVTAPFESANSLLGIVSYGGGARGIPDFIIGNSTEIISLESADVLKIGTEIDTTIRMILGSRGAPFEVSGNSTHRYVTDCYPEMIQVPISLRVDLYNLPDARNPFGSPGYRSGSITIDVPITHDPVTNICYLNYEVVEAGVPPAIPFLAIPGVIVYFNATHISLCDGV
jgi:hypothetical protein